MKQSHQTFIIMPLATLQSLKSKAIKEVSILAILLFGCLLSACGQNETTATPTPEPAQPTAEPTPDNLPEISAVSLNRADLPRYESLEMTVDLTAEYENPFDLREVSLDGVFTAPGRFYHERPRLLGR